MNKADPEFFDLLLESYRRSVGAEPPFLEAGEPHSARWLYRDARDCVVAHNTDADPRFIYANMTAQACFEYPWNDFLRLPSRLSAEEVNRDERQRLLDAVARNGVITNYRGIRITGSGRRFLIEDGTVWQLLDTDGIAKGQAAMFKRPDAGRGTRAVA